MKFAICFRMAVLASLLLTAHSISAAQELASDPFREVLAISEWTPERFDQFADDLPLDETSQAEVAKLLLRLRMMPAAKLAEWARPESDLAKLQADPKPHRGELFRLTGQLVRVVEQPLGEMATKAIERPAWFLCEVRLENGELVEVIAAMVPRAWLELKPLDQPVACYAVFLRKGESQDGTGQPQFATSHIAWYPDRPQPPYINFGMATLGSLGVDLAEWESTRLAGRLAAEDHAAFYETLSAMRKVEAGELLRLARGNLSDFASPFRDELAQLTSDADRATKRGRILREIVAAADEDRYSVWPMFLEADTQRGQLFAVDGDVRRAVKIETSIDRDGNPSDAMKRFGVDHYYEVELFTEDSQNLPLVFCVLDLPEGFPTGDDLHVPVRVAGFFFKTWRYHGRQLESADETGAISNLRQAPLLIGRGPLRIGTSTESASATGGMIAGGVIALFVAAICAMMWWFGREDRRFAQTTLARIKAHNEPTRIELPPNNDG